MYCKKQLLQLLSIAMFVMAAVSATAQTQLIKSLKIDNGGSSTVVPLWLKTPFSGNAATDSVLTWNPVDFSVRKIPVAALSPQLATKDITAGTSVATATNPLVITNGAGQVVGANNAALAVNNTAPLWNANQLNGAGVTAGTSADNGKVLTYNSTSNSWAPASTAATANNATLTENINGTANTFTADASADKTWTSFYAPTAAGTSGQMLISAGTNNAPTWTAVPTVNNAALTANINNAAKSFTANSAAAVDLGTFYAPTTAGTGSTQMLVSGGTGNPPTWTAVPTVNNAALTANINNAAKSFTANSAAAVDLGTFYAPTTAGTGSTQMLVSGGTGNPPTWTNIPSAAATDWQVFSSTTAAANADNQFVQGSVAIGQNTAATVTSSGTLAKLTVAGGDAAINTLTVGKGAGQVATNTALGYQGLYANTTGANNTAVGYQSLDVSTLGAGNTAIGSGALGLTNGTSATTGANNTALGYNAGANITTGSSNIVIGNAQNVATATGSNQLNIGGTIYGTGVNNTATSGKISINAVPGTNSSTFEVNGASTNTTAYSTTGTTIDFTQSNLAYTTASAGAFTLQGMKSGGTYTLAVQGLTQGVSTFTQSGLTFRPANGNGNTLAGYQTIYTFIVMGTTVYFWMTTGI